MAVAVHAVLLSQELQRSRERLVAAREEERRRLRRDLHDGLGPILTAVTLKTDAARGALATAPDRTDALLAELRGDANQAIGDLRRVIYDLRPASLDELGLLGRSASRWTGSAARDCRSTYPPRQRCRCSWRRSRSPPTGSSPRR